MKFYQKILPNKFVIFLYKVKIKIFYLFYTQKYRLSNRYIYARTDTTDMDVFKEIFIKDELRLHKKVNPQLIIDCGAYVGYSSIYFNKQYPQAKIYSIEPEKNNFNRLVENCRDQLNILPINAAIWNKSTNLLIEAGQGEWNFTIKESFLNDLNTIKSITIDDLLTHSNLHDIDILKIDIEGSEFYLFDSECHSWLSKVKILFIELHEKFIPGSSKPFYDAISKYKWKKYKSGEKLLLIKE